MCITYIHIVIACRDCCAYYDRERESERLHLKSKCTQNIVYSDRLEALEMHVPLDVKTMYLISHLVPQELPDSPEIMGMS